MNKKKYTITQVAGAMEGKVFGNTSYCISELLIDSRMVSYPKESLFFALVGPNHNGADYLEELIQIGVRCFVVKKGATCLSKMKHLTFIEVENPLHALQKLTAWHLSQFAIPTIAITGSNGKTIVKEWLAQLLSQKYVITKSPLSYNSQVGVPLSVWLVDERTSCCLVEAGISEPNEMQRLQSIIKPTFGIFTHLGEAHQEYFSSLIQKCEEKMLLFKGVQELIYCRDNQVIHECASRNEIPSFTWGISSASDLRITSRIQEGESSRIELLYKQEKIQIIIPFIDQASLENAMNAFTLAWRMGIPLEELKQTLNGLHTIAMRQEIKEGIRSNLLINDSYNSDISSIRLSLKLLDQKSIAGSKKVLVLSDIYQSGYTEEELYKEVYQITMDHKIDLFIGIGSQLMKYRSLVKTEEHHFFLSTDDLLQSKLLDSIKDAHVLIKGARPFRLEKVVKKLEKKSYQTTLEVNLGAITDNLNFLRKKLHSDTLIMAMVKANAYGCGAIEVARHLQYQGCNYLAVALADEGAELRASGIQIPIVVMNPEPYTFDTILESKLELEIYSFELLKAFHQFLIARGVNNYPIHLKIDSGMHRLGFEEQDLPALCEWMKLHDTMRLSSVFSHLAASDDNSLDSFTLQQVDTFVRCTDFIENSLNQELIKHILNSSGVQRFPQFQMNMVRLGIGLYAKISKDDLGISSVCSLKTKVLQTKKIKKGETVGYGRKGIADHDLMIAILPIGYADGLSRACGNGQGQVLWKGVALPFIGNICMDMSMISLGNHAVEIGDEVCIFGEDLPPYLLAEQTNTIAYEILTGISSRVKKIYLV